MKRTNHRIPIISNIHSSGPYKTCINNINKKCFKWICASSFQLQFSSPLFSLLRQCQRLCLVHLIQIVFRNVDERTRFVGRWMIVVWKDVVKRNARFILKILKIARSVANRWLWKVCPNPKMAALHGVKRILNLLIQLKNSESIYIATISAINPIFFKCPNLVSWRSDIVALK